MDVQFLRDELQLEDEFAQLSGRELSCYLYLYVRGGTPFGILLPFGILHYCITSLKYSTSYFVGGQVGEIISRKYVENCSEFI